MAAAMARLRLRPPPGMGIVTASSAVSWTWSGTPAVSRPNRRTSMARRKSGICRPRPGREQDEPASLRTSPGLEGSPIIMTAQKRQFEIVHARPPERPVRKVESGRRDDVDGHAETGTETENGSGIASDVGLVERDAGKSVRCHLFRKLRIFGTARLAQPISGRRDSQIGRTLLSEGFEQSGRGRQTWIT